MAESLMTTLATVIGIDPSYTGLGITAIFASDGVYMLKGWENSKGATAERALAIWLGKVIRYQE